MKTFIKEQYLVIIGVLVGAIVGYLYWKNIGCASGTCMITSKPFNSVIYFGLLGGLLFSMFKKTTSHVK
jgi:hypothetical protein